MNLSTRRTGIPAPICISGKVDLMGAVTGRTHRDAKRGAPTVLLQGRVAEPTREAAREAADELGISMAAYLEKLVLADAQHHLVRPAGPFIQEELPVSA